MGRGRGGFAPSALPWGFAYGEQGLRPCTPPEEALPPLDSSAKGVFDPSGLPFLWIPTWAERRVTDAPHDRTWVGAYGCSRT